MAILNCLVSHLSEQQATDRLLRRLYAVLRTSYV